MTEPEARFAYSQAQQALSAAERVARDRRLSRAEKAELRLLTANRNATRDTWDAIT